MNLNELVNMKDASFGYEGKPAVTELNFSLKKGDYLFIVGENGGGKSTLVGGLLGLRKPLSGAAHVHVKKNRVGYLPQQTAAQKDFPASVYEVVISGRLPKTGLMPFYRKKDKAAALQNMEKLNVADLRKKCFRELSGGQQRRVLLARALCSADELLVLDEPAAGLDPESTRELYLLLERLRGDGLTLIMVSHDTANALRYATHILHLGGRQEFFGSPADYAATELGHRYLGNCFDD